MYYNTRQYILQGVVSILLQIFLQTELGIT